MKHLGLSLIAIMASTLTVRASEQPAHRKLSAVPFTAVKVQDQFWAPRIRTNRERSLPHNFKWCEETGRISNFAKAGGLEEGKFEGIYFNDSDVYKVLEGASYSLADYPDPVLDKTVEDVVAKIAAAQQDDGYLNTYYTLAEPGKRWTNFHSMHELYCAGHLIEAAVAHYRATGKRTLLDVAIRYADHIDRMIGPEARHEISGHEEIELALVKLFEVTGNRDYFDLARYMLDLRGDSSQRKTWGEYCQDHMPVRQQSEVCGHAVRAMYLYAGVADVAAYTGDQGFVDAMGRIWQDVVLRKMYITGGVGARHQGEAFGDAYELPNESAYCETCAAIGLVLWAHRLNLMHQDAQYADVLERALYNGILSGIALDGEHFFYVNPLASSGNHHRQPFYGCACCPTNVVRTVPSVPGYVYASGDAGLFVNLYAANTAEVPVAGSTIRIAQETDYPWDGRVKLTLQPAVPQEFTLSLRIPGWCQGAKIALNGQPIERLDMEKGYARISRKWMSGDVVELVLAMEVERIEAHPRVTANGGRVAIQRGPIVYCFEAADNLEGVRNIILPRDASFTTEHRADLLGGVTLIKTADRRGRALTAVPYYAWDHRQPGEMAVWVWQDGKPRQADVDQPGWEGRLYRPLDPVTLGEGLPLTAIEMAVPSASFCYGNNTIAALNDQVEPADSCDHNIPRFTWWDHRGTSEWVQYDFAEPQRVSAVSVYWFDDEKLGRHCRTPQSWRVLYRDGGEWKPVAGAAPGGTEKDRYNRVSFEPVTTSALRLEVELKPTWSGGILEWKVE